MGYSNTMSFSLSELLYVITVTLVCLVSHTFVMCSNTQACVHINVYHVQYTHMYTQTQTHACKQIHTCTQTYIHTCTDRQTDRHTHVQTHTIVLNVTRHIIIDHVLDILKIQSLGCYICCNQHIFSSLLELTDVPLSLLLVFATVNTNSFNSFQ